MLSLNHYSQKCRPPLKCKKQLKCNRFVNTTHMPSFVLALALVVASVAGNAILEPLGLLHLSVLLLSQSLSSASGTDVEPAASLALVLLGLLLLLAVLLDRLCLLLLGDDLDVADLVVVLVAESIALSGSERGDFLLLALGVGDVAGGAGPAELFVLEAVGDLEGRGGLGGAREEGGRSGVIWSKSCLCRNGDGENNEGEDASELHFA
ncbi:hypothetical protein BJ508DRAFT_5567 [Ascobolus immersus RN42]|uniref:Uncharacterized protein n=1 Tax=Ascobolus immersus RN42 TaxID=1160509 RepID=A0A3N4IQT7_ASCIM|nr:hypothetical protein BJ508DRAFT_5567 [Ascobolus immersus RN42]